jgi:hypothetical protein
MLHLAAPPVPAEGCERAKSPHGSVQIDKLDGVEVEAEAVLSAGVEGKLTTETGHVMIRGCRRLSHRLKRGLFALLRAAISPALLYSYSPTAVVGVSVSTDPPHTRAAVPYLIPSIPSPLRRIVHQPMLMFVVFGKASSET